MPDLTPTDRFRRTMSRIERRYLADVRRAYRRTRRSLLDALVSSGQESPILPALFREEFDRLALSLAALGPAVAAEVDTAVSRWARDNFAVVNRTIEANLNQEQIRLTIATEQARIARLLEQSTVPDVIYAQMVGELFQLQAGGDNLESAINRLVAARIVDRASVWRSGLNEIQVQAQIDLWSVANGTGKLYFEAGQEATRRVWRKQAVAAIDERTTDCCLRVHGQIVGIDDDFTLTGTPRFADKQQGPPFHWWCRTATTIWLEEFEDIGITTRQMRDAANSEIKAREETGTRVEIHPASATSRRR